MRRAVLSHLRPYPKTSFPLLSRSFITQFSSLSSPITTTAAVTTDGRNHNQPSPTHLKTCTNSHGFLLSKVKTHQFLTNPSQNFTTHVEQPSQIPSKPGKIEEKSSKLEEEEKPKSSKDREANFDEGEKGIDDLRKYIEIKEMKLWKNSKKLGKAYRDLSVKYYTVSNNKEALTYCLKALETHLKAHETMGHLMLDVASDRGVLEIIYNGLEEYEKALEQNHLRQEIFKSWGLMVYWTRTEIDAAKIQIELRKYDEAINTLKSVIPRTHELSKDRAMAFVSMAKALCERGKFESKKYLEDAFGILGKKEETPTLEIARAYMEMSKQYEMMKDFETAISLLEGAQAMLKKLPQDLQCSIGLGIISERMGSILMLTRKVEESVPYWEDAAERLKEGYGSMNSKVGHVYCNLGAAYLQLARPQSAVNAFAFGKEIMDVSLGPHHKDSISAGQALSIAYADMGRYTLALNFLEKATEALEGHHPDAKEKIKAARCHLELLKNKAHSASSVETPSAPS